MRWLAVPVALAATLAASPSFAVPRINTISSEVVSTSPLRVKTTFTVQLVGYEPFGYSGIEVFPGTGPAVQFFDCQAPAGWNCGTYPPESTSYLSFDPPLNIAWPWPGVLSFSITTDQADPCVDLQFWNPLLAKTPQVNDSYDVHCCLVVDAPTPTASSSWGHLKAIYR